MLGVSCALVLCGEWEAGLTAAALEPKAPAQAPQISFQPLGRTVTAGGFMAFAVIASGNPSPTYQWTRDGQPLSDGAGVVGSTSALLSIEPVLTTHAGLYAVAVSNAVDGLVSSNALLTVNPLRVGLPEPIGGGQAWVPVLCQPGDACRLDVTTNFINYDVLGCVTNQTGTARFLDPGPVNVGLRLYRATLVRTLPVMIPPAPAGGGAVRLIAYGWRNEVYDVQASSDFQQWDRVAKVADLTGWVDVRDVTAAGQPLRFYRVTAP